MFRYFLLVLVVALILVGYFIQRNTAGGYASDETTLSAGKRLFMTQCSSCHALEHDGIGPRLGGITSLLSEEQLIAFIRDPDKMMTSGNERALMLRARYKQTMPSYQSLDNSAIHSILSYINNQTETFGIQPLAVNAQRSTEGGLTGRLVTPVKKSALKIELEDHIYIPRLKETSPDLGIVTLRPHPSGNGILFVNDQGGVLYRIHQGRPETFLDLRTEIKNFSVGPGIATGFGSFDFHPDFLNNGLMYITHAEKFNGQAADYTVHDSLKAPVQWVLSEWKMDNVDQKQFKGTRRELLRLHAPHFGHGAQEIAFVPGLNKRHPDYGKLYIGFGDGGSNIIGRPELGHNLKSFLGTIMRIDPRGTNSANGKYGIPADNPFLQLNDGLILKEIWAYGFRNPHRVSWDPLHGNRMIVTDIGESNIEEINIVEKGGDYGWPLREGVFGIETSKDLKTVFKVKPGDRNLFKQPFIQYDHLDGFAVSGGYVYDGKLETLRGKYFFGDIVNGKLFFAKLDENLSDSSIYSIAIIRNNKETTLSEMSQTKRLHLRIAYDRFSQELFVITKSDGMIRRVVKAY